MTHICPKCGRPYTYTYVHSPNPDEEKSFGYYHCIYCRKLREHNVNTFVIIPLCCFTGIIIVITWTLLILRWLKP
jgi:hypothetical protein